MKTAGNERGVRGVGRKGVEKEGIIIFDILFSDILHYHVTTYWSFRLLPGGGGLAGDI